MASSEAAQLTWWRRSDVRYWAAAAITAIVAGLLMSHRVGDAPQGFLAYNEGFYLSNGARDAMRSFFAPINSPIDPNNPFLYPIALATALRIFGVTTAVARGVSIAASTATILLTFALGKELYNERIGLTAAVFFALTPGEMLVGRNIQVDALMLTFMVAASFAFARAAKTQSTGWSAATGALLGLGVLTKLPALLLVPGFAVWELWCSHDFSWIRKTSTWVSAAAFSIVAVPWYAYRYLASSEFRGAQSYLAGTGGWKGLEFIWNMVFGQIAWMFSPVLIVVIVASLTYMAVKRQVADKFVISMFCTLLVVFLFYNYHVYYYLPLVPFGAIASARGTAAAARWLTRGETPDASRTFATTLMTATTVLAVVLLGFALMTLSAKKYIGVPTDAHIPLLAAMGYDPAKLVLGVDDTVNGWEGPAIIYHAQQAGVQVVTFPLRAGATIPADSRLVVLTAYAQHPGSGARFIGYPIARVVAPVVFGQAVLHLTGARSYFHLDKPTLLRVGPWWRFGFEEIPGVQDETYGLYEIPH